MFWTTSTMLAGFAVAICLALFAFRRRLGGRAQFAGTASITILTLAAMLSAVYEWDGPNLIESGAGAIRAQFPQFEKAAAGHQVEPELDAYRVWLFGDSTHVSRGSARLFMASAVPKIAADREVSGLQVDGFSAPGFDAYEYYFALNRLVENPPDLVVIPLNLRSFGFRWYAGGGNVYPVLERYCQWENVPRAVRLSSERRRISWPAIALRKLDYRFLNSDGEAFVNGMRIRLADSLTGTEDVDLDENSIEESAASRAERRSRFYEESPNLFDQTLDADHPLLRVLHEINRLAEEHGIGVMYYTVQTPDLRAQAEKNFAFLRFELTRSPMVRFVDMQDVLDRSDFELGEHVYDDGFMRVASRLLDEIVAARDDAAWRRLVDERGNAAR